jgi:hypothetical protein
MFMYGYPQVMLARWGDDPVETCSKHAADSLSGIWLDYALARCAEKKFTDVRVYFGPDLRLDSILIMIGEKTEAWQPRQNKSQLSEFLGVTVMDGESLTTRLQGIVESSFPGGIELISLEEPVKMRGKGDK